ncbi:hypothetical protein D0Z00_004508 [Geotrichum galactomycetum]|uniref:Uncharacterized protein n=1 Tax=Geotrichum galactomycetum TaxID=27317 RepID=A0ACB6UY74_9ASCO|nr:hypothetical protein D0Z00_004508 [Geotrichum candidum]
MSNSFSNMNVAPQNALDENEIPPQLLKHLEDWVLPEETQGRSSERKSALSNDASDRLHDGFSSQRSSALSENASDAGDQSSDRNKESLSHGRVSLRIKDRLVKALKDLELIMNVYDNLDHARFFMRKNKAEIVAAFDRAFEFCAELRRSGLSEDASDNLSDGFPSQCSSPLSEYASETGDQIQAPPPPQQQQQRASPSLVSAKARVRRLTCLTCIQLRLVTKA